MTKFVGDAGEQRAMENRIDNILTENRAESEKSNEQISERDQKTVDEANRLARSIENKQSQERQEKLILEREKLAERIAAERSRVPM